MEYPSAPRLNLAWLFCAIAMALGWGIRGELGGPNGAAVPGAFLGLAIAIASGRPSWVRAAPIFGMAGALGFALGGSMSYGLLIGYTKGISVQNVAYGYAVIGLVGGLWGAFGAGCLGFAASPVRYPVWQIIALVFVSWLGGQALHWLLVDTIGLRANPGRGDAWPQSLAAVLGILVLCQIRRDPFPARLVFWGFAAGSAGFMIGESFQIFGSFAGPEYDWWKIMEQGFGFIMGAGIAWAVTRESRGEADAEAPPYALTVFGVIVTLWLVPVLTFENVLGVFSDPEREELVTFNRPGGWLDALVQLRLREFIALGILIAVAYALRTRNGKLIAIDFAAKLMFTGVVGLALILSGFKKSAPQWEPVALSVHTGFLIMAVIVTLWVWFAFPLRPFQPTNLTPPPLRIVAPIYFAIVFPILVFALAAASIATHPGEWRHDARIRFGDPPPGIEIPEE